MRIISVIAVLATGGTVACGDDLGRRAPEEAADGPSAGGEDVAGEQGEAGGLGEEGEGGEAEGGQAEGGQAEGGQAEGGEAEGGEGGPGEGGEDPPCTRAEHCDLGQTCDLGECIERECDEDSQCQGSVCGDGLCRTLARDCWAATNQPLFLGITLGGDRSAGGRNLNADCAGTGLVRERIVRWDVDDVDRDYVLTIETDGFLPVVSLLSACEDTVTAACFAFDAAAGRVALPTVQAGSYWIAVDGFDEEAPDNQRFRLTVSAAPGSDTPGGETCADAEQIEFDEEGRAQVAGDLIVAGDDVQACGEQGGGDWFYRFDVPEDSGLTVSVQSDNATVAWELRGPDCEGADALTCLAGPGSAPFGRVPAGAYHLVVDGPGDFLADLTLTDAPPAPANDGCGAPARVRLGDDGEAVIPGDTSVGSDTRSPTCGDVQGKELTYRVEVAGGLRLRALLRSAAGGTLSVRETCGGEEPDLLCAPAGEAIRVEAEPEDRTLHLIVEAGNAIGGPFELVVQALPPSTGDTCDDPIVMAPTGNGIWRAEGSTVGQADDYVEQCGGFGGPSGVDVYVAFEVDEVGNFFFGLQAGFDANLHLLGGVCQPRGSIVCNDDAAEEGLQSALIGRDLAPGEYWLVVDGHTEGEQGPFTLTAERLDPPANGECADGQPVALDPESGVGRVAGSLRVAADQSFAGCAEQGWGEVWYTIDLAEPSSLRLFTSPEGGFDAVGVGVYDAGCGQDELDCVVVRPGQGAVFLPEVGPGTIPIVVEGPDTATFELVIQSGPAAEPPANESCDSAEEVVFDDDDQAVISGQLIRATDDHEPACGGDGPDAAHVFELAEARQVLLTRTPAIGDSDLFVSAWTEGCEGDALSCVAVTPGRQDSTRLAGSLGPGRVWVIVEAGEGADLGYELTIQLDEAVEVPANDQCGGAIRVEFDVQDDDPDPVVIEGNTELAQNDYEAGCAAGAESPDVVYEIEMVRAGSLDVLMVADGGWDNALHLRRGECHEQEAELLCNDDNPGIGTSRITNRLTEPGTYYIIADGYNDANAGPFTLTVDVGPEPRCPEGVEVVVPDEADPDAIVIEGTTVGEENSVEASCASNARSPDVMYTFELDRPRPLLAVMEAEQGWDNALHLRAAPCVSEQAEIVCNDDFEGIGTSRIEVEMLQPGVYFLFADGYAAGNEGAFELTIDFGPAPPPPANDACEAAEALVFEGPTTQAPLDLLVAAPDQAACVEGDVDAFWSYAPQDDGPYSFAVATTAGRLYVADACAAEAPQCSVGAVVPDALGPQVVAVSAPADAQGELLALIGPSADALDEGDSCDDAMGLPAAGTVAIFGAIDGASDAVDHGDPGCPAVGGGRDRVFGLFLQGDAHIHADVIGAGFSPHLWLRADVCEDDGGGLQACGSARGGWSTLDADVGEGLITLVVDSLVEDAGGDFLLVVTTTPAEP